MGGINHQPCRAYLAHSTKVSRSLSEGVIRLESANVAFENLILETLDGCSGSTKPVAKELRHSVSAMRSLIDHLDGLVAFMRSNGYMDLPPLRTLDLSETCRDFHGRGMITGDWASVVKILCNGGFYAMFATFRVDALAVIDKTERLAEQFDSLDFVARKGGIERMMEENGADNIRPLFAQVYTAWSEFHQRFLASSLVSAEVWYVFSGAGSMREGRAVLRTA